MFSFCILLDFGMVLSNIGCGMFPALILFDMTVSRDWGTEGRCTTNSSKVLVCCQDKGNCILHMSAPNRLDIMPTKCFISTTTSVRMAQWARLMFARQCADSCASVQAPLQVCSKRMLSVLAAIRALVVVLSETLVTRGHLLYFVVTDSLDPLIASLCCWKIALLYNGSSTMEGLTVLFVRSAWIPFTDKLPSSEQDCTYTSSAQHYTPSLCILITPPGIILTLNLNPIALNILRHLIHQTLHKLPILAHQSHSIP